MKLVEQLKYKARCYIYQIEQEAYITKNKLVKENEKAQKVYGQKAYEQKKYQLDNDEVKNMNSKNHVENSFTSNDKYAYQNNMQQEYTKQSYQKDYQQSYQQDYNKEDNLYSKPAQKHYKDSNYYDSAYSYGEYKDNQVDYYDVYPDKYIEKNQKYPISKEEYLNAKEKEYSKNNKLGSGKRIITKIDELEDYLEQAFSGIKRS
ncbi:MAG: hypothetical protein RR618_01885 [Cellulosilyticaceae bacterium]